MLSCIPVNRHHNHTTHTSPLHYLHEILLLILPRSLSQFLHFYHKKNSAFFKSFYKVI